MKTCVSCSNCFYQEQLCPSCNNLPRYVYCPGCACSLNYYVEGELPPPCGCGWNPSNYTKKEEYCPFCCCYVSSNPGSACSSCNWHPNSGHTLRDEAVARTAAAHQEKLIEILEGQNKLMSTLSPNQIKNNGSMGSQEDLNQIKTQIEQLTKLFKEGSSKEDAEKMLEMFRTQSESAQQEAISTLKEELNKSLLSLRTELEEMSKKNEVAVEEAIKKLVEEEDPEYDYTYEVEYEDETEDEENLEEEEVEEEEEEEEDVDLDNSMVMELPEEIREMARKAGLEMSALNELIMQWSQYRHNSGLEAASKLADFSKEQHREAVRHAAEVNKLIAGDRELERCADLDNLKVTTNHEQQTEKLANEHTKLTLKASVDKKLAKEKRRTANKRDIAVSTVRAQATEKVLTAGVKWISAGATLGFISWVAGTVALAYFGG